ncbi:MAG: transglutaminase family protein, partial [Magnetococcales bacterium]|nr:transglutaminase family protein [Magnetococcales bacterium]
WYPGEPLPRWRYAFYWRTDGQPVWRNQALLAWGAGDLGHDGPLAERFLKAIARELGVDAQAVLSACEDPFHHLWQEMRAPVDRDPTRASAKDSLDRQRLAALLQRGVEKPTGYVLPLRCDDHLWQTAPWPLRRGEIFLMPGDSPLGLRLPLDSLPDSWNNTEEFLEERSPFAEAPPLPPHPESDSPVLPVTAAKKIKPSSRPAPPVRSALCAEVRQGVLNLFLPPLVELEHFLELVAAIERVATRLDVPVLLEGYDPPSDPRLRRLLVTPDPGVIEVNVHPAASWQEMIEVTTTLYAEARASRLATEKFMLDGRHTGTGGGNHVVIGGATPSDSPLLRRPDLLRSLITCWQHHPGLSYLFSGLFIGPTSQAPRVDEARSEALYELEIAFQQMPEGEVAAPWLVDRLLRHLLVDLTGNTHRAEFCIDKLYSPEGSAGRLGLLELRAFEMPPHARMSLVQMLLLRSLIAWFWREPYKGALVRWGTELHDRFMLPHYVRRDVLEVTSGLRRAGIPFQDDWIEPFVEFRFPRLGAVSLGDITLELRMAMEPWHVLGEELTRQGTARFVDSSLERIQAKVTGLTPGRHLLTCNGRRVPLRPTGEHGQQVAGIRFRAWQPPSALHPTIGVHTPLTLDLMDTWNGCSLGGCVYHAAHPGGRNHELFPVNSFEAEARRGSRFQEFGHTPGATRVIIPSEEAPGEYPHTLDMRRRSGF